MYVRTAILLAAFAIFSTGFPEGKIHPDRGPLLARLDEIDQCLEQMENDIQRLRATARRLKEEKEAVDIRQTPEYRELERRFRELQEKTGLRPPRSPAEIWEAMGNPKELARRLDLLAEKFAPTVPDEEKRKEFREEVEALKKKIGEEVSQEELQRKVRERLSERLKRATSEREKAWLQRQLEELERSKGPELKASIDRFVRIENVRAMHELAEKYSIPRELMVECGLAFIEFPRRPPRRPERGEGPEPPMMPPRGEPRPPRDRRPPEK